MVYWITQAICKHSFGKTGIQQPHRGTVRNTLRGMRGDLTGGCLQQKEDGKRSSQRSCVGALLTEQAVSEWEKPCCGPPFTGDRVLVLRARVVGYGSPAAAVVVSSLSVKEKRHQTQVQVTLYFVILSSLEKSRVIQYAVRKV